METRFLHNMKDKESVSIQEAGPYISSADDS